MIWYIKKITFQKLVYLIKLRSAHKSVQQFAYMNIDLGVCVQTSQAMSSFCPQIRHVL